MINLPDVTGENDLGPFTCPRNNCFDLMRREILGFIHNEVDLLQAATANVCERRDEQLFVFEHLLNLLALAVFIAVLVTDNIQVVVQRLHIWIKLGLNIARKEAEVAVAKWNDRAS